MLNRQEKTLSFAIAAVGVVICAIGTYLLFSFLDSRDAVDANKILEAAQSFGYSLFETTEESKFDNVDWRISLKSEDGSYCIDLYGFKTRKAAADANDRLQPLLDEFASAAEAEMTKRRHDRFVQSKKNFCYVYCADGVLITTVTRRKYADDVKSLLVKGGIQFE